MHQVCTGFGLWVGGMGRKARLANKTIWALEDIEALAREAEAETAMALTRARKRTDYVMSTHLAIILGRLAKIELKTVAARNGEYRG